MKMATDFLKEFKLPLRPILSLLDNISFKKLLVNTSVSLGFIVFAIWKHKIHLSKYYFLCFSPKPWEIIRDMWKTQPKGCIPGGRQTLVQKCINTFFLQTTAVDVFKLPFYIISKFPSTLSWSEKNRHACI